MSVNRQVNGRLEAIKVSAPVSRVAMRSGVTGSLVGYSSPAVLTLATAAVRLMTPSRS